MEEASDELNLQALFQAAQKPSAWFMTAEHLRDAAEIILRDQVAQQTLYLQAVWRASGEARAAAAIAPDGSASAEINCESPNYLPAQLLYAFAIENALKGLIITENPTLLSRTKISVKSHDLINLAEQARFDLTSQEIPVLKALSHIAEWAGRYPVATRIDKYVGQDNRLHWPESLLDDWGSQHPTMRACLERI